MLLNKTILTRILLITSLLLVSSCSSIGYLAHTSSGHLQLMAKRQAITDVIQDENTAQEKKQHLTAALRMREFASRELLLPENKSYTSFVELERDYVTWVVFASEEFSLQAKQWCFWVAGCVPYRGYFDKSKAEAFSVNLINQGYEVYIAPVPAYSTLGWFSDPLLSSMITRGQLVTAEYIFHELAHQKLYLKNDSQFNEAFATAVAQIGVEQWLAYENKQSENRQAAIDQYQLSKQYKQKIYQIISKFREQLEEIYQSSEAVEQKRNKKAKAYDQYKQHMSEQLKSWQKYQAYRVWLLDGINNAKLNAYATYYELVPSFIALYKQCDNNWQRFYQVVKSLEGLEKMQRREFLSNGSCE